MEEKRKLVSFGEHYIENACWYLFKEYRGTIVRIDDNIGFKIGSFFIGLHSNITDFLPFTFDNSLLYELQYYDKEDNKELYKMYEAVVLSFSSREKGFLYLLKCQNLYKIGITSDYNKRLTQYKTSNPFEIEEIFNIEFFGNKVIEKHIIEYFKNKNVKGKERFEFDDKDLKYIEKLIIIQKEIMYGEEYLEFINESIRYNINIYKGS